MRTCTSRRSWKRGNRVVRREFLKVVFCSLSSCSLFASPVWFFPFRLVDFPVFSFFVQRLVSISPRMDSSPQMTTQPSTYPRRSRHRARIDGREAARRTLGTHWKKPERRRKRWSWDLKTVSWRHCRSSGSHKTPSASVGQPPGRPLVPSLSEGRGTLRVVGKEQRRMSKAKERAPDVSLTLATHQFFAF